MRPRSILFLLIVIIAAPASRGAGLGATPADAFRVPDGFVVDLLYEVPAEDQGSWVSLTVDPRGRLVACDQYGSLYRITLDAQGVADVERLDVEIGMAQGLLFAFDSLYVNVNDQSGRNAMPGGVYRLRDTNGDDAFDSVEHLLPLNNGGEHGPHALVLSPDGKRIFLCAGNNTFLPERIPHSRVPRHWSEDHLLGRMPDARGHNADRLAPGGFVAAIDPDGKNFELIATGFRNHYDIAFNSVGELFTFDADMEWDVGTPWYRPTRVNHVISGAEFGWRNGTGKWPAYYPDSFGAAVDIGPGSPTGICFGSGAEFPERYQRALFVCDWSYGNIFAVHLEEDGSTYSGTYETFATAAPLPVTDAAIHPEDGAMYFAVGGRRAQSALYRIRYVGEESTAPAEIETDPEAVALRELRHSLEAFHVESPTAEMTDQAVAAALPQMGHPDRAVRFAARIAIEHQPVDAWRNGALSAENPHARILGVVALARSGTEADREEAIRALLSVDWEALGSQARIDLLRAYALTFIRLGDPASQQREQIIAQIDDHFPADDGRVSRELATVLVYLRAPEIIPRVVAEMIEAPSQEDQIFYAMALRDQQDGWTEEARRAYFAWFNDAASSRGGMSFGGFLENIRAAAIATLNEKERELYDELLEPPAPRDPMDDLEPREFVKKWTVEELAEVISTDDHTYDFQAGKRLFAAAQCYKCHRMGVSGGILGPDLTGAGGRFNAVDLAVAIVEPSKEISDQYSATQFLTESGRVVVGKVINMHGNSLHILTNLLDPSSLTTIDRNDVEEVRPAPNSMMPAGLLDTLNEEEVLDLLAYLRSGGNPTHPLYEQKTALQE